LGNGLSQAAESSGAVSYRPLFAVRDFRKSITHIPGQRHNPFVSKIVQVPADLLSKENALVGASLSDQFFNPIFQVWSYISKFNEARIYVILENVQIVKKAVQDYSDDELFRSIFGLLIEC
jgi:hypothetical protein